MALVRWRAHEQETGLTGSMQRQNGVWLQVHGKLLENNGGECEM